MFNNILVNNYKLQKLLQITIMNVKYAIVIRKVTLKIFHNKFDVIIILCKLLMIF